MAAPSTLQPSAPTRSTSSTMLVHPAATVTAKPRLGFSAVTKKLWNMFCKIKVGTLTSEQQRDIEDIITNYLELQASLTSLSEHTIGAKLNQYTNTSLANNEAKETAITTIQDGLKDCESSDISTAYTQVQKYISEMNLNKPSANTFLRIKGYVTEKYAKAGDVAASIASATQIPNSVNKESDGSDIWYYDAEKHLVNYKNGLGTIETRAFAPVGQTMELTTFAASTCTATGAKKIGVYEIKSNYSGSKVWYSNDSYVDRNSANDNVNCEWVLEEVTTLPVTITAAGYATLYAPVALTIPDGVTAYVATDNGNYLTLTAIDGGIIPANTGVILAGAATTYNFGITTGGSVGSNALTGTVAAIARPDGSYILSNGTSGVGFYKDGATTIPGFKAYLAAGGGGVKTFRFNEETAIEALESAKEAGSAKIYNLAGQRVTKAKKGIYIVGGRKVVIK